MWASGTKSVNTGNFENLFLQRDVFEHTHLLCWMTESPVSGRIYGGRCIIIHCSCLHLWVKQESWSYLCCNSDGDKGKQHWLYFELCPALTLLYRLHVGPPPFRLVGLQTEMFTVTDSSSADLINVHNLKCVVTGNLWASGITAY